MIVVDTNVICYLYLASEHSKHSEQLLAFDAEWVAPRLWRSEFRNVLALYLRKELIGLDDAFSILRQAEELLAHGEYDVASAQVMQLASTSRCSAYDCEFVALARYLGVPLVTEDRQLLEGFPSIARTIRSCLAQ